jgi:hypothetical protein
MKTVIMKFVIEDDQLAGFDDEIGYVFEYTGMKDFTCISMETLPATNGEIELKKWQDSEDELS